MGTAARGPISSGELELDEVVASTRLIGRKQDRFLLMRRKRILAAAVFDGHSPAGQSGGAEEAEHAARAFHSILHDARMWRAMAAVSGCDCTLESLSTAELHAALSAFFQAYQQGRERLFDERIRRPLLAEKARLEAELDEELPQNLPLEGGCTATLILALADRLVTAWVGDSDAVLVRVGDGGDRDGDVAAVPLTTRRHQPSDEREAARVTAAGGTLLYGVLYAKGVDGGLRVTRALGDCALHEHGGLSAQPDVASAPRSATDAFVLIASDGLWEGVSFQRAAELAAAELRGCGRAGLRVALRRARDRLFEEAVARQSHTDDVTVVVHVLNREHPFFANTAAAQPWRALLARALAVFASVFAPRTVPARTSTASTGSESQVRPVWAIPLQPRAAAA